MNNFISTFRKIKNKLLGCQLAIREYENYKYKISRKRIIPIGNNRGRGYVFIDRWSYYGHSTFSGFHPNDLLVIGSFCSIADNVTFIVCNGNHYAKRITNFPIGTFFHEEHPDIHRNYTRVGNDVWIGNGAIILPGIRIGNGAIVGAGSVVSKDVEDFSVVSGNPSSRIKWRFEDEAMRKAIQNICWWEWSDKIIKERQEFFLLSAGEAIKLAEKNEWIKAKDIPSSYLNEIKDFFPRILSVSELDNLVRDFLYREDSALMLNQHKTLSFENIAVWIALLKQYTPKTIVEYGARSGCSSVIIARLCRYLEIKARIISIYNKRELIYRDPAVEYINDDFKNKIPQIWKFWNPDVIFQNTNTYPLIHKLLIEGEYHRDTIHVLHNVGFRSFKNPTETTFETAPSVSSGYWERHALAHYSKDLLEVNIRSFFNDKINIHIFDACADSNEYGVGVLKFA